MTQDSTKTKKEIIYENGRVSVFTSQFTITEGDKKGEVKDLVQIQVIKKKWSDDLRAMYDDRKFVVMTKSEFADLIKSIVK